MEYQKLSNFPKDFLWGASTSAYQVEGAALEDGKGPSVQDVKDVIPGTADFKVASDFYHHYKEDIEMMAEMGMKTFRFSISWARLLPQGRGEVNQQGIEFYNKVIDTCIANSMEPFVTMYHFDLPAALDEKGGWSNPETIDAFEEFSRLMFTTYGDRVKYWLTINEQNMMILHGSILGTSDINEKQLMQDNHHMLLAQAKAMKLCHELCPNAKIGPAPNITSIYPNSCKPEDVLAADTFSAIRNWLYLDMAVYGEYNATVWSYMREKDILPEIKEGEMEIMKQGKPDFIAFNYYCTQAVCECPIGENNSETVGDQQIAVGEAGVYKGVDNPYLPRTDFGWQIDPVGFRNTLREVYSRYRLPIIITENGLGAYDKLEEDGSVHDSYRINYLREHIHQLQLAISDGVKVFGYCPWSAIDLISTHQGFAKRYGFIYVNRDDEDIKDLKRYRKDSFFWYKKVIASNGEDLS